MKYFIPMLAILFIALKLTHVIAWSWWLVLLPLYAWIPLLLIFGFGFFLNAYFKK